MKYFFLPSGMGILMLLWTSCSNVEKQESPETFQTLKPLVTDTTYTDEYVAEINALQNVEIRSRIKGFIEKIHMDEGQSVKKGQILFSISSKEHQHLLQKAKALTKSAQAELKSAEIERKHAEILFRKNIIAEPEYEMTVAKTDVLQAKVEEAELHEAQAEFHLSLTEIRAPFDGIINRIPNKAGSLIEEGMLLTTLSNIQEVYAYFNVSESEYLNYISSNDKPYREVSLILANGETYSQKGYIETSESEFDQNTGNIAFRARFNNPDGLLKHGANGKIVIEKTIRQALIIPQKSTFEIQDRLYVYVVKKDSSLEQRNITVKLPLTHVFIIESGIKPDETIVYEGVEDIREGMKISPKQLQNKNLSSLNQ